MKATQLRALIASQPWLVDEEWFMAFAHMVLSDAFNTDVQNAKDVGFDASASESVVSSGVGVIPVSGPLFNSPNFLTEILGIGTTYDAIKKQVRSFVDNSEINSILFDYDCPGGVVSGVNETASVIATASEKKPIYSYVGGVGASAAYWLMSGSHKIAIDATARVGSIGVVASFLNPKYDMDIEIVNSASPNKRPDITKDAGKKVIVEELDALADVFINTVAENRDVTAKTVKEDFGKGGCLVGKRAVDAGMADDVMFFSEFLEEIKGGSVSKKAAKADDSNKTDDSTVVVDFGASSSKDDSYGGVTAQDIVGDNKDNSNNANNSNGKDAFMDIKTLKEKHPDVYQAIVDEAKASSQTEIDKIKAENDTLKADLEKHQVANNAMTERVQALEKSDALRAEKDMKAEADAMINSALSASKIPARLHSKVANQLDHNKFVTDNKLDREGFKAAIDAEVKDWEGITAETDSIQGMSFNADQNVDSSSDEVDTTVDRMSAYIN